MSALSQLLERLRRLRPPPGAPSGVLSVPAPGEDVADEVAFLFGELDALETRTVEMATSAREGADAIDSAAREERRRILGAARERADSAWDAVLSERRAAAARERDSLLEQASGEARAVLARGRQLMPTLVADVLRRAGGEAS